MKVTAPRDFIGVSQNRRAEHEDDRVGDASILNFRRRFEKHELIDQVFAAINTPSVRTWADRGQGHNGGCDDHRCAVVDQERAQEAESPNASNPQGQNAYPSYGFELDRDHVKELLATLGVGLTSQYVEQIGRKLLGGLLGKIGGDVLGGLGSVATGAGVSFATTYALGQVAVRYYAGGRSIYAAGLQQAFASMLAEAKELQGKYTGQIVEQARALDLGKLFSAVKV